MKNIQSSDYHDLVFKNIIPNPDSLREYFSEKFSVLFTNFLKDKNNKSEEKWFFGILENKIE